ncbi:creatininase family protein [Cyanobacteria bacterium FACHB-DQ100]|uniref:creatininase family protein n=1 Tax=unclassified Leptolyngbya TaxID=2650499 RepID=UPI00168194FB|nr:creatininase family protein [Leptolyngbya sp. FACHB-17]MBD1824338.1 creatininase family protein [Cyanobacteria bacterium FACHB-DQ100]MBD2082581.1 creatininase family protein [Leptolyngbya sp. FACHB-17]
MMHGFIPSDRYFPYLSWTDIESMPNKENVVIVQPIGAIEQHGAHLPLAVDSAISVAVLGKALSQLDPNIPAYALPPLYYGKSNEHWHFPGTITLSTQTLLAVLIEVAESIYRAGFRKLVFINSHGGQPQILEIAARDLHQQYEDFALFPLFTWKVPTIGAIASELFSEKELELGIHAGDVETSLLLSILPDQVKMERAKAEYPLGEPQAGVLSMEGALPFAWMTRDLSRSGVLGDPTTATKEKGDRILTALVNGWVQVLEDVYQFSLPTAWKCE